MSFGVFGSPRLNYKVNMRKHLTASKMTHHAGARYHDTVIKSVSIVEIRIPL